MHVKRVSTGTSVRPWAWNIILNSLLEQTQSNGGKEIIHADVVTVFKDGKSLAGIELKGEHLIKRREMWCIHHKFTLSNEKTEILFTRGTLALSRSPWTATTITMDKQDANENSGRTQHLGDVMDKKHIINDTYTLHPI